METLFRKLCQTRTLLLAWKTVKQKGSSGGVDGVSIDEYDQDIGSHITQIQNELKSGDWPTFFWSIRPACGFGS